MSMRVAPTKWMPGYSCPYDTTLGTRESSRSSIKLVNSLRPRQNGRHFADDTFKRIFLNENIRISIEISLKFVPSGPINNIPALVQIMAWRRPGDKPLSEPVMARLLTHICVTRSQWVKNPMYSISFEILQLKFSTRIDALRENCYMLYLSARRLNIDNKSTDCATNIHMYM